LWSDDAALDFRSHFYTPVQRISSTDAYQQPTLANNRRLPTATTNQSHIFINFNGDSSSNLRYLLAPSALVLGLADSNHMQHLFNSSECMLNDSKGKGM